MFECCLCDILIAFRNFSHAFLANQLFSQDWKSRVIFNIECAILNIVFDNLVVP